MERGNFEKSKVSELIVDSPSDLALAFDLESLGDALQLRDRSRRRDGAVEVREVGRNRNAGARVPNDGARVCFGVERFSHACRSLKSHAKRRGMTRKVNVRQDFVGGSTLMKRERSDRKRVRRVGGCHRAILGVWWRRTWAFGTPGRTRRLVFVVSLSLLACGRRQRSRATGVAKLVGATLETECAFLESREVTKVVALSERRRSRCDVALLSETERVRAVQLVGSNTRIEAWRCERLLEESRETATLIASKRRQGRSRQCDG